MVARRWVVIVVLGAISSLAAQYRTKNFIVEAPTSEIAKHIGDWAEYHRKKKAIEWIGHEMPTWGQPCPLQVKVTYGGSGGATSFAFDRGRILSIDMQIEGTLERLTYSVLPHEVTHTVFAYHYRCPVPRWADEGGSVLSEDDQERTRHDQLVRQILNTPGRSIPLRRLFSLTQYPRDVMVLYAEGYSVTNFLVARSSRKAFLAFVGDGMQRGWDAAAKAHYGYRNVDELEQAWLQSLRDNRRQPPATTLVSAAGGNRNTVAASTPRTTTNLGDTRRTLPPALPVMGAPRAIVRGQSPEEVVKPRPQGISQVEGITRPVDPVGTSESWANPTPAPASDLPPTPRRISPPARLGTPRIIGDAPNWTRPSGSSD